MPINSKQPILYFCKTSMIHRTVHALCLPPTCNAMMEIMGFCMQEQIFRTPTSLIQWFCETLNIKERMVKQNLKYMEECTFILKRETKCAIINPALCNKYEVLPGHIAALVVDPAQHTEAERRIFERVNSMWQYNSNARRLDPMHAVALEQAHQAVANLQQTKLLKRIEELEKTVTSLKGGLEYLMDRAKADDVETARSMIRLV